MLTLTKQGDESVSAITGRLSRTIRRPVALCSEPNWSGWIPCIPYTSPFWNGWGPRSRTPRRTVFATMPTGSMKRPASTCRSNHWPMILFCVRLGSSGTDSAKLPKRYHCWRQPWRSRARTTRSQTIPRKEWSPMTWRGSTVVKVNSPKRSHCSSKPSRPAGRSRATPTGPRW